MTLTLCGQPLVQKMQTDIIAQVRSRQAQGQVPKIVTLLVDGDAASTFYARAKKRCATKLGIEFELMRFPREVSERTLKAAIHDLNEDPSVHGIMLELPLPAQISVDSVTESIHPWKDVDGLTQANRHANISGSAGIYPATPMACARLVEHHGYNLSGKHVVLVGCGKTVGMPLFHLLVRKNATVTVCHAGTPDVAAHLAQADIAFVAVGRAGLVTPEMVHRDLVVVDAGINEAPDGGVVGDVDAAVLDHVAAMSPTPGGVGPVTTMQLFANLLHAMELQVEPVFA